MVNFYSDHLQRLHTFKKAKTLNACCGLLGLDATKLELLAQQPDYHAFYLPKARSEIRLIEDPSPPLKTVQQILNTYLQSVYFFEKSHASFGFIVSAIDQRDQRNILTNARKHLRRPYLFQVDLQDFFHSVTAEMVFQIFSGPPLQFSNSLAKILTQLTTLHGRLPMGAPTSPVLSNLACRRLDEHLFELTLAKNWVFTRYSDDFAFSAMRPFSDTDRAAIREVIESEGFEINDAKTRETGPDDEKIVTGILLRGTGDLKPTFVEELRDDIRRLAEIIETQNFYGAADTPWVGKMKQQVQGKLAFVGFVLGKRNPDFVAMRDQFRKAKKPPKEQFGAISWQGFHYLG
jgi:hypothetical protein